MDVREKGISQADRRGRGKGKGGREREGGGALVGCGANCKGKK